VSKIAKTVSGSREKVRGKRMGKVQVGGKKDLVTHHTELGE